ncbi:agmatine deiminase family protein [Marinilabilia salmonicolor]|nr:agmatine deiminase family protein [Marinilabilia salmonicolor]
MMQTKRMLPGEWAPQNGVILAWPHSGTDWAQMLDEVRECFVNIIEAVTTYEKAVVLVNDENNFPIDQFTYPEKIKTVNCPTNDTWARDFGPIFVKEATRWIGLDYKFDGWGLKFAANEDNLITSRLFEKHIFGSSATRENHLHFVLEGGSIESDGQGTILTTTECLTSANRNGALSKKHIEEKFKNSLGAERVLWIDHGFLTGDDTDSHVDTLARFCNPDTIAYVKCEDTEDEHYSALKKMEQQLHEFRTGNGKSYNLVPLPMADAVYEDGHRLPATYANFLIINEAVLLPFYKSPKDQEAKAILENVFRDRKVIGIDCLALIKQHGSLHCVTMQLPEGTLGEKS